MMRRKKSQNQHGMTLVEILIAMLIGLVLLSGVLTIFTHSKQTYRMQEALSRLQENSRFAMDFISRDVRQAGFLGCNSNAPIENLLNDPSNAGWDFNNVVLGFDNVSGSFTTISNVVVGTDVIIVRRTDDNGTPLVSPYTTGAQEVVSATLNNDCPTVTPNTCHEGEIVMVTDCSKSSVFQITNTQLSGGKINVAHSQNLSGTYTPGNSTLTLSNSYGAGSKLVQLETYAYYIRQNPDGINSLYRSKLSISGLTTASLAAEELVEGVQDMQILYGADTDTPADGVANYYVAAATSGLDMSKVVSVRISLLMQTIEDNITSSPVAYTYNSTTTTPTDRRLRRINTFTIALRNRLI
jgi:type IV pilus assembly protein PilW